MNLNRAIGAFKEYVYKMPKLKPLIADDLSMHFQAYDAFLKLYSSACVEEDKASKQHAIMEEIAMRFEYEAESNLNYLSIIGSISPFVGLFGTVFGIMHSLQSIATASSTSIAIVAPGISEALFATAVGLCVAIPAAIATHLFYEKIEKMQKDMRIFAMYLVNRLENNV